MSQYHAISRRVFLGRAAGAVVLSGSGAGLLAACSDGTPAGKSVGSTGGPNSAATTVSAPPPSGPPAFTDYAGVTPDLPGTPAGVMPAFYHYPENPVAAVSAVPGKGGDLNITIDEVSQNLVKPESNQHWQAVQKKLGVNLKVRAADGAEYTAMVQTTLAGNELPDVMMLVPIPDLAKVLEAKFANLSEYLSGDAVKDYPMLAAIPTATWNTTLVNGGIYGLPCTRAPVPINVIIRTDCFTEAGVPTTASTAAEFLDVCRGLTIPKKSRWAWGEDPATALVPFAQQMLGVPNVWAEQSGKFTSSLEAPETKQAIDFVAGMWKEGLVHPDAIASPLQMPTWFAGKKVAMSSGGLASWGPRLQSILDEGLPALTVDAMVLPKFDGGGVASYWRGVSSHHMTALKKASPDRIREILGVFNWLAAPFGTQEYLLKIYGIEGRNYTRQGSDPVPIPHQEELMWFLGYMTNPAEVLYAPGHDDVAKRQHEVQEQVMPTAVANPTEGLVSATQLKSGAAIQKKTHDAMTDIITARKPLSTWDDAVKQWKSGGGDAMRQEYEAAFAETR